MTFPLINLALFYLWTLLAGVYAAAYARHRRPATLGVTVILVLLALGRAMQVAAE